MGKTDATQRDIVSVLEIFTRYGDLRQIVQAAIELANKGGSAVPPATMSILRELTESGAQAT